jgi:hypothetical protein
MKVTALSLAFATLLTSLPVRAAVITTAEAVRIETGVTEAAAARSHLQALLAREEVQAGLARHGVSTDAALARVAALSDAEALELSQQMGSLPAGGDVLGVIVFLFLVLLVTDILGFTKIFPFTRPIR